MMTPPPPPPAIVWEQPPRWDYQPVKAKKVRRHVIKVVTYDRNICTLWNGERPRKRFIRRYANLLVTQNSWGPYGEVRKGIRRGFRAAC